MCEQNIIDKVRGLFAKTTEAGATEAEAQTAVNIAQKIMAKYHLSEEDLAHEPADDYSKVDKAEFNVSRSFVGKQIFAWESYLAHFVKTFVGCPCYLDKVKRMVRRNGVVQFGENEEPKFGASIVWFGVAEDARMAADLYDELRMLIATMAVAKWGNIYRGDGAAYSEGFVMGLCTKLEVTKNIEQKDATSSTALVLIARRDDLIAYKETAAVKWINKEKGIKLGKSANCYGSHGSHEARNEGRADGAATDVGTVRKKKIGYKMTRNHSIQVTRVGNGFKAVHVAEFEDIDWALDIVEEHAAGAFPTREEAVAAGKEWAQDEDIPFRGKV